MKSITEQTKASAQELLIKHAIPRNVWLGSVTQLVRPRRKKEVVVFHNRRCGSTVLSRMLSSSSEVSWGGEIFNKLFSKKRFSSVPSLSFKEFVDIHRYSTLKPVYGFEIPLVQINHPSNRGINQSPERLVDHLEQMGITDFVLLDRHNLLRKYVSALVGRKSGSYHSSIRSQHAVNVHLNITEHKNYGYSGTLLERLERDRMDVIKIEQALAGRRFLRLRYEEHILEDPKVAYGAVCKFLGVPQIRQTVPLKRTNPYPLNHLISNYQEVEALLKGTDHEWMLTGN